MSGLEEMQDTMDVKALSIDNVQSLGGHDIEESGDDQILTSTDDLSVGQELKEETGKCFLTVHN